MKEPPFSLQRTQNQKTLFLLQRTQNPKSFEEPQPSTKNPSPRHASAVTLSSGTPTMAVDPPHHTIVALREAAVSSPPPIPPAQLPVLRPVPSTSPPKPASDSPRSAIEALSHETGESPRVTSGFSAPRMAISISGRWQLRKSSPLLIFLRRR
ncbi:hypothetical protein Ahy_B07g086565 isoform B [Arachis hypogaea]|uniref:Uncharacterized protein n=1 Tax=Arachis hypogaea TaxID=3818 RepID=A0A444YA18_ARAHY|nr:hypothetical protein Ahy_B07g086565 isoform B [Arachis hypogaea]